MITCSVCLNDFEKNEMCNTMCNHFFCESCLLNWLKINKKTCPFCRLNIDSYKYKNDIHKFFYIIQNTPTRNVPVRNTNVILINKKKYISLIVSSLLCGVVLTFSNLYLLHSKCDYF